MSWQGLWFLSGHKLGQYADKELLKSLFQNKTPDLSLKYHWSKCMTGRVSSKNKEKRPKGKIVLKKRPNRKQKLYKETLNSVAGSRTTTTVWRRLFSDTDFFYELNAPNGVTTLLDLSWWSCLLVSMTPKAMSVGALQSWLGNLCRNGRRVETRQRVTPWSSTLGVGRRANDPAP